MASPSQIQTRAPGERHYAVAEIASMWNLSTDKVRDLFEEEPGVLLIGRRNPRKRRYVTLRIPESVVERVHSRLSSKAASQQKRRDKMLADIESVPSSINIATK
jgi:hypothetical protein